MFSYSTFAMENAAHQLIPIHCWPTYPVSAMYTVNLRAQALQLTTSDAISPLPRGRKWPTNAHGLKLQVDVLFSAISRWRIPPPPLTSCIQQWWVENDSPEDKMHANCILTPPLAWQALLYDCCFRSWTGMLCDVWMSAWSSTALCATAKSHDTQPTKVGRLSWPTSVCHVS